MFTEVLVVAWTVKSRISFTFTELMVFGGLRLRFSNTAWVVAFVGTI